MGRLEESGLAEGGAVYELEHDNLKEERRLRSKIRESGLQKRREKC